MTRLRDYIHFNPLKDEFKPIWDNRDKVVMDTLEKVTDSALTHEIIERIGECIICAAIQFTCGKLIRGHRHSDCIRNAIERDPPLDSKGATQGFITSKNRFVDRREAMRIQQKAGIRSMWTKDGEYNGDVLFSEDLY